MILSRSSNVKPDRCKGCPLYETGVGPVSAALPRHINHDTQQFEYVDPRVVIVTDWPDPIDAQQGPYQNPSAGMLKAWLAAAGIKPSLAYLTYLCKCHNPDGIRPPKAAIEHCKKAWLDDELTKYSSTLWIVSGKEACEQITGEPLNQAQGYFFRVPGGTGPLVPISSVSDVIKNPRDTGATRRFIHKAANPALQADEPTIFTSPPFSVFADFLQNAARGDYIVFDTETFGLVDLRMQCIGITDRWGKTMSIAWSPVVKNLIAPLFANNEVSKVAHNIVFDARVMAANGIEMTGDWIDTMRLVQLDDVGTGRLSLEAVAPIYLNIKSWKRKASNEGMLVYNAKDTYYTYRIFREVQASLQGTARWRLWERTKNLEKVVTDMETRGFAIDVPLLQTKRTEITNALAAAEQAWQAAYPDVNPNSPVQLKKLFESKGIKFWLNHEGKESTAEASLRKMKARQPNETVLDDVLQLRALKKVASVYLSEDYMPGDDGALHTHIKITGTVSGRPSFSKPNLGNIPKNKDHFNIRDIFVSRPGYKLVSADWSQAETRVTAILADETIMLDAWRDGRDIHKVVASALFKTKEGLVTKAQREIAKRIVYALSYGSGSVKIAEVAEIPLDEAKSLIRKFAKEFPHYFGKLQEWGDAATSVGYLVNPFGRVHNFTGDRVYTQARNFIPQSTVADMMNIVLCQVWGAVKPVGAHVLLQIYDQIILEVPETDTAGCDDVLKFYMNQAWPELNGNVIPADVTTGKRWGEL